MVSNRATTTMTGRNSPIVPRHIRDPAVRKQCYWAEVFSLTDEYVRGAMHKVKGKQESDHSPNRVSVNIAHPAGRNTVKTDTHLMGHGSLNSNTMLVGAASVV